MKIRTGFVSNSSSSSFCIYGTQSKQDEFDNITERLFDYGLSYENGVCKYLDTDVFVGFYPWRMKEDETHAQFKDRVKEALEKVLNREVSSNNILYFVDGGYNG